MLYDPFADLSQGDLRVGSLQHCRSQTQQYIATPVVVRQAAGRVGQVGRTLEQAGTLAVHIQRPAGLAGEPLAQALGLAPYGGKVSVPWRHERTHQQAT
ncbi:hypothetical protein D3C85_1689510 [compost metagenome]